MTQLAADFDSPAGRSFYRHLACLELKLNESKYDFVLIKKLAIVSIY